MHKPIPQILIALVLLIGGLAIWYVDNQRSKERSVLSGFFESQPTDVSSRIGGRVAQILIAEGDVVHKGQTLIVLDVAPDQSGVIAKQDAAMQAHEQLRELENGPRPEDISKQKAAVAEASANLTELLNGPRPQEIAEARAAANAAFERYAAALRGPTSEERAETQAKYESAVAAEQFAEKDAARYASLFRLDAVTKQQNDQAIAAFAEATSNRVDLENAMLRSARGTPLDELEESHQSYLQSKEAYDLEAAGSRREDIAAARDRLRQAQATLDELLAGTRPEDIIQARLAYEQAEATLHASQINIADSAVKAPYDGIVDSIPVSNGDLIEPDAALARLESPTDIWVRVYVPEASLANVYSGVDAVLRVDGIAKTLPAYVESVQTHGEFTPANLQSPDDRGKQVFGVRLRLKHSDVRVKAGMDATVVRIGHWTP